MNRIALQMLMGDTAKYIGLIFGITFATLLMAQQTSIFCGLMIRTTSIIQDVQEADIWVMHPRVLYLDEVEPMPNTALDRVRSVDGVHWAVPLFRGNATARVTDGQLQQVVMIGVDDATLVGAPPRMIVGRVEDLRQPDAMIIDRAGFLAIWPGEPLQTGKVLELNDRRAVIVGICEARAPFVTFPIVYTRYSLAMRYAPPQRNMLSYVLVKAKPGVEPALLAEQITARSGLQARPWLDFAWQTVFYFMARTGIPINFGITVLLGFLVGAAIAGQTFYLFVIENLRQFGALKAIGVSNARIMGMVMLQGMVVGLFGYGIGIGLAAAFFEFTSPAVLNLRGFFMPWEVMVATAVAVLVIVLLASVASIRKLFVLDPAIVFRG